MIESNKYPRQEEPNFKYNEGYILDELFQYIKKTYGSHYGDKVQAQDLIISAGHSEGFYIGNIIKYASRYGKKNGHSKDDLMKVLHYAVLAMNHHKTHHEKDK
jgi:DNA-binding transcriptional MocR family regulator